MTLRDELVAAEQAFWRAAGGDREGYDSRLADDALHVFPGWGIAERDAVLDAVAQAEPWREFTLDDARALDLGDDAAALVYTTRAVRADGSAYTAAITSVYRRSDEVWQLALHQQTPLG
jgi:hypothetical protein